MAGQPQDPSWQPAGQDQTQARPAWPQQPGYSPLASGPQDAYAYQQEPPTQGGYPPPPPLPLYGSGQERAYAAPDQQAYQPQDQQGYQPQAHPQADPRAAQWQATPPLSQPRLKGERGFIGSLFDFSFTSMVTPKLIKALYILITISTLFWAAYFVLIAAHQWHTAGALSVLIIVDPLFVLVTLALWRVLLEYFMVTFRLHEDVKVLRRKAEGQF